jgi:hypothetical protein
MRAHCIFYNSNHLAAEMGQYVSQIHSSLAYAHRLTSTKASKKKEENSPQRRLYMISHKATNKSNLALKMSCTERPMFHTSLTCRTSPTLGLCKQVHVDICLPHRERIRRKEHLKFSVKASKSSTRLLGYNSSKIASKCK